MDKIHKGRFCNTIIKVALVHTSIQSNMQAKEILSTSNSQQTKLLLGVGEGWFLREVMHLRRRRWVNLKISLADFVYVVQKPSRGHYDSCTSIAQL